MAPPKIPLEDRFRKWTKRDSTKTGCWIWTGKIDWAGYAHIKHNGRDRKAATVSFEFHKGLSVPKGMEIHHTCHVRACVNPDHLVLATRSENSGRRRPYTLPSRQKGTEHRKSYQKKWREEHAEYLKAYYRWYDKHRR